MTTYESYHASNRPKPHPNQAKWAGVNWPLTDSNNELTSPCPELPTSRALGLGLSSLGNYQGYLYPEKTWWRNNKSIKNLTQYKFDLFLVESINLTCEEVSPPFSPLPNKPLSWANPTLLQRKSGPTYLDTGLGPPFTSQAWLQVWCGTCLGWMKNLWWVSRVIWSSGKRRRKNMVASFCNPYRVKYALVRWWYKCEFRIMPIFCIGILKYQYVLADRVRIGQVSATRPAWDNFNPRRRGKGYEGKWEWKHGNWPASNFYGLDLAWGCWFGLKMTHPRRSNTNPVYSNAVLL